MLSYRVGIIGTGRVAGSLGDKVEKLPFTFLLPYSHAGAYAQVASTTIVAVAFHVADQTGGVVTLPIADVDYAIADTWGRYS